MTVTTYSGPAGCGKTFALIEQLSEQLAAVPLQEHQKVLAVTFMRGSRQRLEQRLCKIDVLAGRYIASTLDSFAWKLAQNWRRLRQELGFQAPAEGDFELACEIAAALLSKPIVRAWVKQSYPILVVDEAQDLDALRSSILASLADECSLIMAFDEFQCLRPELLPISIEDWIGAYCETTQLEGCRRTDDDELINGALAVRAADAVPRNGKRFKVVATPSVPFAATFLSNAIGWRGGGSLAVLTPSRKGNFVLPTVARVATQATKKGNGPYPIEWEDSSAPDFAAVSKEWGLVDGEPTSESRRKLALQSSDPTTKRAAAWLRRQQTALGNDQFDLAKFLERLGRQFEERKRFSQAIEPELSAMTIQQAKNREFEHVVVLWPYTVPNGDDNQRRLLYNAITRAKRSCLVLAQSEEFFSGAPFA